MINYFAKKTRCLDHKKNFLKEFEQYKNRNQ